MCENNKVTPAGLEPKPLNSSRVKQGRGAPRWAVGIVRGKGLGRVRRGAQVACVALTTASRSPDSLHLIVPSVGRAGSASGAAGGWTTTSRSPAWPAGPLPDRLRPALCSRCRGVREEHHCQADEVSAGRGRGLRTLIPCTAQPFLARPGTFQSHPSSGPSGLGAVLSSLE